MSSIFGVPACNRRVPGAKHGHGAGIESVSEAGAGVRPRAGLKRLAASIAMAACIAGILLELRTSWLQSRLLTAVARRMTFSVAPGLSAAIRYPRAAPYDERLGYSRLPAMLKALRETGYEVTAQARSSRSLVKLTDWGTFSTYTEKPQAGLRILDRNGHDLFSAQSPERVYRGFEEIPAIVVQTLLFIENRELLQMQDASQNPAIEWVRLGRALAESAGSALMPERRRAGASTLATQLEKIRHSPEGRTVSVREKGRQMLSASLRAYQGGYDTTNARKRIVLDFTNSTPLAAQAGYGEVIGLGDGLWAWFGSDLSAVNRMLAVEEDGLDERALVERARAYRQVLSLFLAHRRPTAYLIDDTAALRVQTDRYLGLLCLAGIISPRLRDSALRVPDQSRQRAPLVLSPRFVERKGPNAIRSRLLSMLGLERYYDLDRLDLTVSTTIDGRVQEAITETLRRMQDLMYATEAGLRVPRLLETGDPASVVYSFTLYERQQGANLLRVQTDNYDQPLNISEGTKLELGSTAKLRTLVTYLEIVAELHQRWAKRPADVLESLRDKSPDRLSRWAAGSLLEAHDRGLGAMLECAMDRRYSADPAEAFFTGGGIHRFANFDAQDNSRVVTVREAFHRSVNLAFIRLMRDIVEYYKFRAPGSSVMILEDRTDPLRAQYLSRFADREGRIFLGRFYRKYRGRGSAEALDLFLSGVRPMPSRLAAIYRLIHPEASRESLIQFLRWRLPGAMLPEKLHDDYGPERYNLTNRSYIAGVHPLELWLVAFLVRHPEAGIDEMFAASARERREVYEWLFKTRHKSSQDKRIRTLLELDAFREIHRAWQRHGYPFDALVPSYATAIGSSGDRPAALAELIGIIQNEGIRYPSLRIRQLHFAQATPYETVLKRSPGSGERTLSPEIASLLRRELIGVVAQGTGMRANRAVILRDGTAVEVGGKTGTGDNRVESYGASGQRIDSKVLNRTATFVFLVGDRFFGTVTAYVPGNAARGYTFTSALPVQVFKHLVPALMPLLEGYEPDRPDR